eukprot:1188554-Prorocentrum_minimum.AAC.1
MGGGTLASAAVCLTAMGSRFSTLVMFVCGRMHVQRLLVPKLEIGTHSDCKPSLSEIRDVILLQYCKASVGINVLTCVRVFDCNMLSNFLPVARVSFVSSSDETSRCRNLRWGLEMQEGVNDWVG